MPLKQPLGTAQPAPDRRQQCGIEEEVHRHPHGGAGGADRHPCREELGVGALPQLDAALEPSGGVGDLGERRDVLQAELAAGVGLRVQLDGSRPVGTRRSITG